MPIKLDSDIPSPEHALRAKSDERKALEAMEIGQSFSFPTERKATVKVAAATVRCRAREHGESKRFIVRGLRVWRVE